MKLNSVQKKQVAKQLEYHNHSNYETDIDIEGGLVLKNFYILKNVLRPEGVTALWLAKWLCLNNGLYKNLTVLDMGSGSGIQGIVTALCGAKKVVCSDISEDAVKNTKLNIDNYKLASKVSVIESDLFEKIKNQKFDLIIFNHPFFSDVPIKDQLNTNIAMFERGQLIHRFFKEVKKFLKNKGVIVMPYYHPAGPINNPSIQALKYNMNTIERFSMNITQGLQKGPVSIYEIRL